MTEKLLHKIRKMMDHADSAKTIGSEAEAQAFTDAVQRLLLEHNLSLADIPVAAGVPEPEAVKVMFDPTEHGLKLKSARLEWSEALARAVAQAHLCDFLVHRGSNYITFVGFQHNAEVAVWTYAVLYRTAWNLGWKEYFSYYKECAEAGERQKARGFRKSFLLGFVRRLLERIYERKRKFQEEPKSMALAVLDKNALAIKKFYEKNKVGKSGAPRTRINNAVGYARGKAAADQIDLDGHTKALGEKKVEVKKQLV